MAVFDKPLNELRAYTGTNPRPEDFDAYWRESLRELDEVDPQPELARSEALATRATECFDLWFTGIGGVRLYAKYLRPKNVARAPAVLQFHGYSAESGDWSEKLAYTSEGFCFAALDCRGQGGRSEDSGGVRGTTLRGHIIRGLEDPDPKALLFRSHYLDTAQLARVIMSFEEVDDKRVGCFGGSQGGGLALACAALEPRIQRCAPLFPFLCDYQRVWEMDLAKDAYEELAYFFRRRDPTHAHKARWFAKLGYVDCQHLAPRIQASVLMQTGLMDTICPPSTQFAAYNKIPSRKEMILYPDYAHEVAPGAWDKIFNFMMQL